MAEVSSVVPSPAAPNWRTLKTRGLAADAEWPKSAGASANIVSSLSSKIFFIAKFFGRSRRSTVAKSRTLLCRGFSIRSARLPQTALSIMTPRRMQFGDTADYKSAPRRSFHRHIPYLRETGFAGWSFHPKHHHVMPGIFVGVDWILFGGGFAIAEIPLP